MDSKAAIAAVAGAAAGAALYALVQKKRSPFGVALVEIPIVDGKLDEAVKVFMEHPHGLKYTEIQPGFISMTLSKDVEKNSLVIMERWTKKEDWRTYERTRHAEDGELGKCNAAFNAVFGPLVGGAPRMGSFDCEASYGRCP